MDAGSRAVLVAYLVEQQELLEMLAVHKAAGIPETASRVQQIENLLKNGNSNPRPDNSSAGGSAPRG